MNTLSDNASAPADPHLQQYIEEFRAIQNDAAGLTAGLTDAQFSWHPAPGQWSMAQCFDHMNVAGNKIVARLLPTLERARARHMTGSGPFRYGLIGSWFIRANEPPVVRRAKTVASYLPAPARPIQEVVPEFLALQDRLIDAVRAAAGLNLSRIIMASPASRLVRLNAATWFASTAAHERRHLWQARQVQTSPNFPRGRSDEQAMQPAAGVSAGSDTLTFHQVVAADIGAVVAMMHEYYAFDHLVFDDIVARAALEQLLGSNSLGRAYVMRLMNQPVGYMLIGFGYSAEFGGKIAFIDELFVRADQRGKGFGTRALTYAEETCRPLGVQALRLEVIHGNLHAQDLYRKQGFALEERSLLTKRLKPRIPGA